MGLWDPPAPLLAKLLLLSTFSPFSIQFQDCLIIQSRVEATEGFEPPITGLQPVALPLGYVANSGNGRNRTGDGIKAIGYEPNPGDQPLEHPLVDIKADVPVGSGFWS